MTCPKASTRAFATNVTWFALLVIVWGAFVRMSGSGDGCGAHWPLCHGEIIPDSQHGKTWIEYTHRALSGAFGIMVALLFFKTRRAFPSLSKERLSAWVILLSTVAEALVGAKLVLWELVGSDQSIRRVVVAGVHLCNTFILLGSLSALSDKNLSCTRKTKSLLFVGIGVILFFITAILGSWGSLSTTLFPSTSLASGIGADFSTGSHFVVRYRIFHPIFSVALTIYLLAFAAIRPRVSTFVKAFPYILSATFIVGALTLATLSPLWLRLSHLLLVDLLWISFVHVSIAICGEKPSIPNLPRKAEI